MGISPRRYQHRVLCGGKACEVDQNAIPQARHRSGFVYTVDQSRVRHAMNFPQVRHVRYTDPVKKTAVLVSAQLGRIAPTAEFRLLTCPSNANRQRVGSWRRSWPRLYHPRLGYLPAGTPKCVQQALHRPGFP